MQTLWTRVAQVRASCHCPQCVSSTSAVARRAAATATRRAPRFWTTSTVWYSGIFAVAATLDLGVKQQRREQWNQAIAGVKLELAQSDDAANQEVDNSIEEAREAETVSGREDVDSSALRPTVQEWPANPTGDASNRDFLDSLKDETVASAEMRANLDSSPFRPIVPEWPASTGYDHFHTRLPPQSIYADPRRKAKAMVDHWNDKKLERVQLCIDAMQLEFFVESRRRGWHEEAANAVPSYYGEHILRPVEETREVLATKHSDLYSVWHMRGQFGFGVEVDPDAGVAEFSRWQRSEGDVPLCNYTQDGLGKFHQIAHDLNTTLRDLFDMGRKRELSQPAVLAKVYHNLSVSPAPPNIDTFNTLLVGLSDVGTRQLVEGCINAMYCSHMRLNEVSLASILNYYTLTGNQEEFQAWVQLMRGQWGGLGLAQYNVRITDSCEGRLLPKGHEKSPKVVQKPSPTPMVFGALVKGLIKFSGFEAALNVCSAARSEGWGLCEHGLHTLLKDCSRRRDWTSGNAIWKTIQALKEGRSSPYEIRIKHASNPSLATYASMLQLCTRCNNRTTFQDVMEQAVKIYPDSAPDLIRLVRAERAEMQASDREQKEESAGELKLLSDIPEWLRKQNLHRYTGELKDMRWQDMVRLDDAGLKAKGVATESARKKLLQIFEQVCLAHPLDRNGGESSWLPVANVRRRRRRMLLRNAKPGERDQEHPALDDEQHLWLQAQYRKSDSAPAADTEVSGEPKLQTSHGGPETSLETKVHKDNAVGRELSLGQLGSTYKPFRFVHTEKSRRPRLQSSHDGHETPLRLEMHTSNAVGVELSLD